MPEPQIIAFCQSVVSQILNRPAAEIGTTDSFSRLGLDSANSVNLILHLEGLLDLELEEDLLTDYTNIATLAAELAARSAAGKRA